MVGIGIFSPPAMITRTDERSRDSMPGTSSTARTIAGAAQMVVTRERSISSTTCSASNVVCTIVVAPTAIIVVVTRSSAPTWYSGPHASPTSSAVKPNSVTWAKFFHARLACVSITPFGRPVVPEVYMSRCRSSAAAGTRAGASPSARRSAKRSQPATVSSPTRIRARSVSRSWVAASASSTSSAPQTSARAPECSRMKRSSGAARRQLIGIAIAPRWLAAKIVARNSTLLYDSSATTSPLRTPRDAQAAGDLGRPRPACRRR